MGLFTELFGEMSQPERAPAPAKTARRRGRGPVTARRAATSGALRSSYGWNAATFSSTESQFPRFPTPITEELLAHLPALIARSRKLAKDDSFVTRYLKMACANIVGPSGFAYQSKCLKANGEVSRDLRNMMELAWRAFSKKGVCDAQNALSMREFMNSVVRHWLRDGECFVIDYRGSDEGRFGISYRIVDSMLVPINYCTKLRNGNEIKMGIEIDARGRMVAVHFASLDSTARYYYTIGSKGYIRMPADRVIHAFVREYDGQLRGFPSTAPALLKAQRIMAYEESEVIGARVGASIMAPIETNAEGRAFGGEGMIEAAQDDDDSGDEEEYDPYGEDYATAHAEIDLEPGSFPHLEPGAKLSVFNPNRPTSAFEPFMKQCIRGLASSLNVPYNTLANDGEGINFSTMRAFELESREAWKQAQGFVIENVVEPMFDRWLDQSILMGALKLGGRTFRISDREQLESAKFLGRRWQWVDPFKDAQTTRVELQERLTSRRRVMQDRGDDPDQVWEEIKEEEEKLREMGIAPVDPKAAAPMSNIVTGKDDDEDDDQDEDTDKK